MGDDNDNENSADQSNSSITVFADDNTTTTWHENPAILQDNIQADINVVTNWFERNDISCSSEKTKLLVVGTRKNLQE